MIICLILFPINSHLIDSPGKVSYAVPPQVKTLKTPELTPQVQLDNIEVPVQSFRTQSSPSGAVSGCGDNQWANYIYQHESSCQLVDENSIGCLGIGQACPGSKLTAVCPNLDYECENAFFTDYANQRYGGWEPAYNFWLAHRWW